MVFFHNMSDWLGFTIDEQWMNENLSWKDWNLKILLFQYQNH